jgi:hypothetical protein
MGISNQDDGGQLPLLLTFVRITVKSGELDMEQPHLPSMEGQPPEYICSEYAKNNPD